MTDLAPEPTTPVARSLTRNIAWSFGGNVVYAACQWGMLIALARLGSPEIVGRFALGLAVTAPIMLFAALKLRYVQATDVSGEYEFADYLALRLIMTAIALVAVGCVLAAGSYRGDTALVIAIVAMAKAVELLSDLLYGALQREERLDVIARSLMIKGIASLLALTVVFATTRSLVWSAIALAVSWLAVFVAYDLRLAGRLLSVYGRPSALLLRPRWDRVTIWRLGRLCLPLGALTMVGSLSANVPRYVVEHRFGEYELGIFSAIIYLLVAANLVIGALVQATIPRLANLYAAGERDRFRALTAKLVAGSVGLGALAFGLALVLGRPVLHLLYGDAYAARVDVLWIVTLAAMVSFAYQFLGAAVTAMRRFSIQLPIHVCGLVAVVVLALALSGPFGANGVALAILGGAVVEAGGYALLLRRGMFGGVAPATAPTVAGATLAAERVAAATVAAATVADPMEARPADLPALTHLPMTLAGPSRARRTLVVQGRAKGGPRLAPEPPRPPSPSPVSLDAAPEPPLDGPTAMPAKLRPLLALVGQLVVFLLIITVSTFAPRAGYNISTLLTALCILLTALCVWMLWSWKLATGSLFDPYSLFLISAMLFNGGQAFLEVFGLNEEGLLTGRFSPETLVSALLLTANGLAAFHLGALVYVALPSRSSRSRGAPAPSVDLQAFRTIGWALMIISLGPAILLARDSLALVLSGGYLALYQQEEGLGIDAGPRLLAALLVPASILILLGSPRSRGIVAFTSLVVVGYASIQFFLGARSSAVMPLVAYAWTYHKAVRPLPRLVTLGVGSVLLFVVFPLVSTVRQVAGGERVTPSFLWKSYTSIDNPVIAILSEMGNTLATTGWTIELVPAYRTYDYGVGYLYAALGVVPNIFGGVHPSVAHGTASSWLVNEVSPLTAAYGGGYGYSFIAEAYLNFGWWGSIPALAMMGFAFAAIFVRASRSKDPRAIALAAIFLAFVLQFARGESFGVIRPLIWYGVVPVLMIGLLSQRTRSTRSPAPASRIAMPTDGILASPNRP